MALKDEIEPLVERLKACTWGKNAREGEAQRLSKLLTPNYLYPKRWPRFVAEWAAMCSTCNVHPDDEDELCPGCYGPGVVTVLSRSPEKGTVSCDAQMIEEAVE